MDPRRSSIVPQCMALLMLKQRKLREEKEFKEEGFAAKS
jgi:hypothetical protein